MERTASIATKPRLPALALRDNCTVPTTINPKLVSWASDIEEATLRQAEKTARLPIVAGHVALMPDAHVAVSYTHLTLPTILLV